MRTTTYAKWVRVAAGFLLASAIALGLYIYRIVSRESIATRSTPVIQSQTAILRPEAPILTPNAWQVLAFDGEHPLATGQNERFRLAGTFFRMDADQAAEGSGRLAIIDDMEAGRQYIVSEGQAFTDDYDIVRIYQDRLIMRRDGLEVEISLGFREGASAADSNAVTSSETTMEEEPALETNRFGKRIGESRWVIQKQALVDYYYELLDHPERIAAVYMSLKPDYLDGDIAGYRLEKEGESEFFDAVGLQEGDRIRKVNSMNMTSQARAEYFIGEFMKDRLGAVVIDIERGGKPEKLIYMMR